MADSGASTSTGVDHQGDVKELQLPHLRHLREANGHARSQSPASGASTPLPTDAPPSAHATAEIRKVLRAQEKRRIFPTVKYEARVSHFDPRSEHRDFRGFYVLFWVGLSIMVLTTSLRNFKETGNPFPTRQKDTFLANIWELGFSDLTMAASTYLALPLHKLYSRSTGLLRWSRGGVWVQAVFQAAWLLYWVQWPFLRNWTWTAQVAFTLHLLTLFMKLHSYAFYNGHLGEIQRRLKELDQEKANKTETVGKIKRARVNRYPSSTAVIADIREASAIQQEEKHKVALDEVSQLREDLAMELTSPMGSVSYPQNLTLANLTDFLFIPTLCYELEYPRNKERRVHELAAKGFAVLGCIYLLTLVSEEFIMPVLDEGALRLLSRQSITDGALILAETTSRLLFPFVVTFLLVFLVIFEFLCGFFAELTRFADRAFYDDWWNTADWLSFSREWNIPVHNFFRRHVYGVMSRGSVSRPVATLITFLISALAHELIMGCITKKLRGYGFFAMMLQMPLVVIQRSKLMRDKKLLNNVLFWCSMPLGLAMMCALYVLV